MEKLGELETYRHDVGDALARVALVVLDRDGAVLFDALQGGGTVELKREK